jgi:signal-transduction protein with cAMP-binding, CBS, and nucleotidyltransferase domain
MEVDYVRISRETSIKDTIKKMYTKRVYFAVITNKEKQCEGIVTDRDVYRAIVKEMSFDTNIGKLMTSNTISIDKEDSFSKARELMRRYKIRHLPVTDRKGCVIGVLTLKKILDEIIGLSK